MINIYIYKLTHTMVRWVVGSILHSGPIALFLVPGHGIFYPVSVMVHIKQPLLLIGTNSPCSAGSGFPRYLKRHLPYVGRHVTVVK